MRWLLILFWVFVGIMLLKSCYDSEMARERAAELHPQQRHFFFAVPSAPAAPSPVVASSEAKVMQTGFEVQPDTPGAGSFTCQVTLKNVGGTTARNIEVHVRPFRGVRPGSMEIGPLRAPLAEDDPLSQYGSWVSFPDLAPGQSATESATFFDHPNLEPGRNLDPEIVFTTDKNHP